METRGLSSVDTSLNDNGNRAHAPSRVSSPSRIPALRLGDNRLGTLGGYTYRLNDYVFRNSWRIGNGRIPGGFVNSDARVLHGAARAWPWILYDPGLAFLGTCF